MPRINLPEHNAVVNMPDDMTPEQIKAELSRLFQRPDHENLAAAAVTGADSLDLQELAPEIKPTAKMTVEELAQHYDRVKDKPVLVWQGTAYVFADATIAEQYLESVLLGEDSEALGYPEKGEADAAVTKDGEIVTDLAQMKQEAEAGNVIWAANGSPEELQHKAEQVVQAIYKGKKVKVMMTQEQIDRHKSKGGRNDRFKR
jgi:hypothetical protein